MSLNSNRSPIYPYIIVGSLTTLGGIALRLTGFWIFNKFTKKKNNIKCSIVQHNQNTIQTKDRTDGVYIQDEDENMVFLTNDDFQPYFEDNIQLNSEIELDECILEHALKLDPMNLRFFENKLKTLAFEKIAVERNIEAITYCRSEETTYCVQIQNNMCNKEITYKKYEIHDFAYELYGNEIYKYIDHPEGYLYDELMSMPPSEYKDMSVSEVFKTFQNEPNESNELKNRITPDIPEILNIEFPEEIISSETEEEIND